MVDTVTAHMPHDLHLPVPSNWTYTEKQFADSEATRNGNVKQGFALSHPATGIYAWGHSGHINYVNASVSRVLYGSNGRLITSNDQLHTGLEAVRNIMSEVGTPRTDTTHFSRVDLVWQFRGDTAEFINAHRNAKHKRIHATPEHYGRRSMVWKGKNLRIIIYDKTEKETKRPGDIVRVELQLRDAVLKQQLAGANGKVEAIYFDQCYGAYRELLMGFCRSSVDRVSTFGEFLAIAQREGWEANGVSAFDLYTRHLGERQVSRLRQQIAAARPSVFELDWAKLLPIDGPPPAVELIVKDDPIPYRTNQQTPTVITPITRHRFSNTVTQ